MAPSSPTVAGDNQPGADTCAHVPPAGLLITSWNTRGFLDSEASSQRTRERRHPCLQRSCESSDIECLQETYGKVEFLRALSTVLTQWHIFGPVVGATSMCSKDHLLIQKTGDDMWRQAVVGILLGNALWVLTPGRSSELVDFSADKSVTPRFGTEIRFRGRWQRTPLPLPTGAFAVSSVQMRRKRYKWPQHRHWTLTAQGSPSLDVD